jgi:hypothetical protein
MKNYKSISLVFIIGICLTSCVMKQEYQTELPQEIERTYFQQETGVVGANGIHFFIEFKKPLSSTIKLNKIYFRNQESVVKKVSNRIFAAHFKQTNASQDLILDRNPLKEYGNKAPVIIASKFDLKANELLLEYSRNGSISFYKICDTKVQPISAN